LFRFFFHKPSNLGPSIDPKFEQCLASNHTSLFALFTSGYCTWGRSSVSVRLAWQPIDQEEQGKEKLIMQEFWQKNRCQTLETRNSSSIEFGQLQL
jgi:hypothetical protein